MSGQEDEISLMKTKILLMIGSQLISWMSFVMAAAYYHFSESHPPSMTYEIFSLVVLPINSILNPIYYSGFYKKIQAFLSRAWKLLVEKAGQCCVFNKVADSNTIPSELEMRKIE